MAPPAVAAGSPLATALQNAIQPKLAEHGWTSGAGDDSALSEYIILMVANGKDQQQIASELTNDLLGLDPADQGPMDFAQWLFKQVSILEAKLNGAQNTDGQTSQQTDEDATMSSAVDTAGASAIPTGPKSMRSGSGAGANGPRGRDRRMAGQIRNAVDRNGDGGIHRVRGAGSRIESHGRGPPTGPRSSATRMQNMLSGSQRGRGAAGPMSHAAMAQMANGVSPDQQAALFQMLEDQSRMMAEILQNGGAQPAVNPKFFNKGGRGGKSLFERVDRPRTRKAQQTQAAGKDEDSTMEEDGSRKPAAEIPCKFQLQCTSNTCPFAHQSPAAPPGTTIDVTDTCSYGAACTNKKCVASHPSPSQKRQYLASNVDCKFYPNCKTALLRLTDNESNTRTGTNASCPFRHPSTPPCRNGADCPQKDSGCRFSHSDVLCRYNPCLNPHCIFKHAEGQRTGNTWSKDHVSDRKFTTDDGTKEELIIPGQMEQDATQEANGNGAAPTQEVAMGQAEDIVA